MGRIGRERTANQAQTTSDRPDKNIEAIDLIEVGVIVAIRTWAQG